ncbi:MAG: hypothetical protein H6737_17505, partial [Alphaproteobacteria bacterium]|nr:hypothetical protein [Alphaproteobacteria bacterium]
MHGSTVQALALAHRIFEHLRFRLNVDQRAPEVVAAELRERCHALQTRPDGLDSYRAAWELVWRGPDLGDCAASEDLVERLADVYAETGLRVADRLLDGARRDELVALSDHLTGLAERLVVDGAQAVADALESPDPWERDVAAAIGR